MVSSFYSTFALDLCRLKHATHLHFPGQKCSLPLRHVAMHFFGGRLRKAEIWGEAAYAYRKLIAAKMLFLRFFGGGGEGRTRLEEA